jgi:transglutaminase/protease-like cytokinesis protein 3
MGCKIFKSLSYDKQEVVKRKRHRRSKYRKRHGKRSGHHHHSRRRQSKDEIIPIEYPSSDDLNNSQYEMKPIQPITNDTVSEHSVVVEELVDIEVGDFEAFNHLFVQQRQQAIDNHSYRTAIDLWQANSLQQLVGIIKSFSKGKSFIDRHWMIFYWITSNIQYDTVAYFSKDYKDQSAEGVFRTRKGVCAGYANLYKYLCDQLQMTCKIVSGYAKGYGFDNREEASSEIDHAWNALEIDNHWYLMESTWGAGGLDEKKQFNRQLATYYFFPRPNEMIYHHLPEDEKWQLLRTPINMT